jgi:type IV fimbrial biogenesis protein FimT
MAHRDSRPDPGQRGFTLIELLVTLTVLAALLGLAAPALQQLVAAQRMRAASFELVSDLVLARSEALKRAVEVQVVPAAAGWDRGWTVQAAGSAQPLAQRDAPGGIAVTTAAADITFDLYGRVVTSDPAVRIGLSDGTRSRCISLDPAGRPKSAAMECPT